MPIAVYMHLSIYLNSLLHIIKSIDQRHISAVSAIHGNMGQTKKYTKYIYSYICLKPSFIFMLLALILVTRHADIRRWCATKSRDKWNKNKMPVRNLTYHIHFINMLCCWYNDRFMNTFQPTVAYIRPVENRNAADIYYIDFILCCHISHCKWP